MKASVLDYNLFVSNDEMNVLANVMHSYLDERACSNGDICSLEEFKTEYRKELHMLEVICDLIFQRDEYESLLDRINRRDWKQNCSSAKGISK